MLFKKKLLKFFNGYVHSMLKKLDMVLFLIIQIIQQSFYCISIYVHLFAHGQKLQNLMGYKKTT